MNKSHVLLWSGGFDSTAILLDMVARPQEFPNVHVIGCGLKNANNYEEDKAARTKICSILDIVTRSNIRYSEQELDVTASCCGVQAPMWAWLSAINVSAYDAETTMTYGYIRGDDYWHYRPDFETAVKGLAAIHSPSKLSFYYPLEWLTKKEIVKSYVNSGVFHAISWGGDTATTKAKEKEELEFLYKEISAASEPKTNEIKIPEKVEEGNTNDWACL